MKKVQIEDSWQEVLRDEFTNDYFQTLMQFVEREYKTKQIFPPAAEIFSAFNSCSFNQVKVVILGQDPYHGAGQAMGLAFSVPNNQKNPPSLKNIFKELESDLGQKMAHTGGDLSHWASQGVLLLNSTLTVEAHKVGSHQGYGWEQFTDSVIRTLSDSSENLVFILWGNAAKKKTIHIDCTRHLVLKSPHPSPLSAHQGFLGSKPFSKTNEYLIKNKKNPIIWL